MVKVGQDLLDEVGFVALPFDPVVLASFRGVHEVRRVDMVGAGRLIPDGGELIIEVNCDHSPGKQHFTVDHEVTHTLLPTYARQPVEDAETGAFATDWEEELLCDVGAATLLLDPRRLAPIAKEAGPSIRTLVELAALFNASLEATARQLARLNLWPCAFVVWEEGYRKHDRVPKGQLAMSAFESFGDPKAKLRIHRPYVATSFPHFLPLNKSVSDESKVAACCDHNPLTHGVEEFDLGRQAVRLSCENYFAPYRQGSLLQRRVVSLLLPNSHARSGSSTPPLFQLEAF